MKQTEEQSTFSHSEADRKLVAKGTGVAFFSKVSGNILQYIYAIVVARILGVDTYGIYVLGFTIISVAGILGRLGLDNAAVKYVAQLANTGKDEKLKDVIRAIIKYSFIASILVAALLYLLAGYFETAIYHKIGLEYVLIHLSISIPFTVVMTTILAVTQGFKLMQYTAYCQNLFLPIANLVLVLFLTAVGAELAGVLFSVVASAFLAFLLALYFLYRVYPGLFEQSVRGNKLQRSIIRREILGFSSPLMLVVILTTLISWTDTLMLGYFTSSNEVGIYAAAIKTAMIISIILLSFNAIFSPMIADLHGNNELKRLNSLFKFTSRWIYTITLPCFITMVLMSKDIMALFGLDFVSGWYILDIVAITFFISASTGPVGVMLVMSGNQKMMMYNSIGIFILNIVANYILIQRYGMLGAALASAVSIIGYNIIMLLQVYWKMKMLPYDKKFIMPTVNAVMVFIGAHYVMPLYSHQGIMNILIYAPVLFVVFAYLIYSNSLCEEDDMIVDKLRTKIPFGR